MSYYCICFLVFFGICLYGMNCLVNIDFLIVFAVEFVSSGSRGFFVWPNFWFLESQTDCSYWLVGNSMHSSLVLYTCNLICFHFFCLCHMFGNLTSLIAFCIVDITNIHAKHYWTGIRTNSMHCH